MIGLGTIVNTGTVLLGGTVGLLIKKGLKESLQDSLMKALGIATLFIGITGTLTNMFTVEGAKISAGGTMLMIISLVIGTALGELIGIEKGLDSFGEKIKSLKIFTRYRDDSKFVEGFVTTSLVTCVGAMTIVGALQDGLNGDASMLYTKSLLDLISSMIFASTLGAGAVCAAGVILVYQGGLTLLAAVIAPLMSEALISNLTFIGSVLIFGIGINLIFGKKIRVGNMLPALLVPIVYELIKPLFG